MSGSRWRTKPISTRSRAGLKHSVSRRGGAGGGATRCRPTPELSCAYWPSYRIVCGDGVIRTRTDDSQPRDMAQRATRDAGDPLRPLQHPRPKHRCCRRVLHRSARFFPHRSCETPDGIAAAFLSCSNKGHHVAFIRRAEPDKFHHAAFSLDSWHEVGQAADIIARYDIPLDIGPTRHGITRGQTIYLFDPSGNRNEVFAGGFIYYPDNPKRVWSMEKIGKAVFYCQRELNALYERRHLTLMIADIFPQPPQLPLFFPARRLAAKALVCRFELLLEEE